jgi:hypothetical protein
VAAGSFSNLYRGYYCGQEVAVKILKEMQDDASQFQEFLQEVSIMRKVSSLRSGVEQLLIMVVAFQQLLQHVWLNVARLLSMDVLGCGCRFGTRMLCSSLVPALGSPTCALCLST